MKQQAFRVVAAVGFLLLVTCASASAQTEPGIRSVRIPFPFTVGEKRLPAGEYRVARVRGDSELAWLIRRRDGRGAAMALTSLVKGGERREEARLVFRRYGAESFLAQIWTGGDNEGRELGVQRRESEVASRGAGLRLEEVAARRE